MGRLGESGMNDKTFDEFVEDEKAGQLLVDEWYSANGLTVDRSGACIGFDCKVSKEDWSGTVEEKICSHNGCIVEFIQDIKPPISIGWFYKTTADIILWAWVDDGKLRQVCRVETPLFKNWIINDYKVTKPMAILTERGYGKTLSIVPSLADLKTCPTFERRNTNA